MKNMVTMSLMAVLLLKRSGAKLKRDVIFCGVADEEAGGKFGSRFMIENHPDKVKAEYSISEAGGFSMEMDGQRFYLVQVAEKGMCWLKIRTRGEPGHGSMPDADSALIKAARIAALLGETPLPQHNIPVLERFVENSPPAQVPQEPGVPAPAQPPVLQLPPRQGHARQEFGPGLSRHAPPHHQPHRHPRRREDQRHPFRGRTRD